MECFRVIFDLDEPVIAPSGIALDGLLAAARVREGCPFELAHIDLPLAVTSGVYHASELFFVGPAQTYSVPYVRSLRAETWHPGSYRDRRGHSLNKVVARDELKNLLDTYTAIATPAAVAWGIGHISMVETLLNSIEGIGKKSVSRGYGRLAGVKVESITGNSATHGLLDQRGYPLRNIPYNVFLEIGGNPDAPSAAAVCKLPRWKNTPEFCAVPLSRYIRLEEVLS